MRSVAVVVSIAVLAIILGIWTNSTMARTATTFDKNLENVQHNIRLHGWTTADKQLDQIAGAWKSTEVGWSTLIHHSEIDQINLALARLREYVRAKDESQSTAELSALRLLVKHIPNKDQFNMKNLL